MAYKQIPAHAKSASIDLVKPRGRIINETEHADLFMIRLNNGSQVSFTNVKVTQISGILNCYIPTTKFVPNMNVDITVIQPEDQKHQVVTIIKTLWNTAGEIACGDENDIKDAIVFIQTGVGKDSDTIYVNNYKTKVTRPLYEKLLDVDDH